MAAVIKQIPAMIEGHHVVPVVVSDGSTDGTAAVAREAGAYVAELPIRRGGGLALRVGYDVALRLGAELVVTLDSDGQHLPEEIPIMIAPILAEEADYVNGSRLLGSFERESLVRHLGVHVFSRIITTPHGAADHRPLLRLSGGARRPPGARGPEAGSVLVDRDPRSRRSDTAPAWSRCRSRSWLGPAANRRSRSRSATAGTSSR